MPTTQPEFNQNPPEQKVNLDSVEYTPERAEAVLKELVELGKRMTARDYLEQMRSAMLYGAGEPDAERRKLVDEYMMERYGV